MPRTKKIEKPEPRIQATLLAFDKTPVEKLEDADWLLLTAPGFENTIDIGRKNHNDCVPAIHFWQDAVKFSKYSGPGTDWANEVHVYTSVGNQSYVEDGATIKINGVWYSANYRKPNGKVSLIPTWAFDPVLHGQDDKEIQRYEHHRDHVAKHEWGIFYGYNFCVWIAHIRKIAERVMDLVNDPDVDAALARRDSRIGKHVTYDTYVAPIQRETRRRLASQEPKFDTDKPDMTEVEVPKLKSLVMQFADDGVATSTKVDVMKISKGVNISIWVRTRKGMNPTGYEQPFDPGNTYMLEDLKQYAMSDIYYIAPNGGKGMLDKIAVK